MFLYDWSYAINPPVLPTSLAVPKVFCSYKNFSHVYLFTHKGLLEKNKNKESWYINISFSDGSFHFLHYTVRAISLILILQWNAAALGNHFPPLSFLGPWFE